MKIAKLAAAGAMALTVLAAAPEAHATVATLKFFSAQTASDTLSGGIVYDYTGSTINSVIAFDVRSSGGLNFRLAYGVPGVADTGRLLQILNNNNGGFGVYTLEVASTTGNGVMFYPEWKGLDSQARLVLSDLNAAGYSSYNGNALTSTGETFGQSGNSLFTAVATIPEPASMALLGLGIAAVAALRRRDID